MLSVIVNGRKAADGQRYPGIPVTPQLKYAVKGHGNQRGNSPEVANDLCYALIISKSRDQDLSLEAWV